MAFAKQNKAYRGSARDWLATKPSIRLLFFTAVLVHIKKFLEMRSTVDHIISVHIIYSEFVFFVFIFAKSLVLELLCTN